MLREKRDRPGIISLSPSRVMELWPSGHCRFGLPARPLECSHRAAEKEVNGSSRKGQMSTSSTLLLTTSSVRVSLAHPDYFVQTGERVLMVGILIAGFRTVTLEKPCAKGCSQLLAKIFNSAICTLGSTGSWLRSTGSGQLVQVNRLRSTGPGPQVNWSTTKLQVCTRIFSA